MVPNSHLPIEVLLGNIMSGKPIPVPVPVPHPKLTNEEIHLIMLLREKPHQEVTVKVKDSVIVFIKRSETFIRKKGGGVIPE